MNPKELLDNLVRDLTTAHPMPKSAVRRRILDLLEAVAVACEGEKEPKRSKFDNMTMKYNHGLDTAANLIRSLKGDEK